MTEAVATLDSAVYDDGIESLGSSKQNVGDGAATSPKAAPASSSSDSTSTAPPKTKSEDIP
jgi:hypothetical protein